MCATSVEGRSLVAANSLTPAQSHYRQSFGMTGCCLEKNKNAPFMVLSIADALRPCSLSTVAIGPIVVTLAPFLLPYPSSQTIHPPQRKTHDTALLTEFAEKMQRVPHFRQAANQPLSTLGRY